MKNPKPTIEDTELELSLESLANSHYESSEDYAKDLADIKGLISSREQKLILQAKIEILKQIEHFTNVVEVPWHLNELDILDGKEPVYGENFIYIDEYIGRLEAQLKGEDK